MNSGFIEMALVGIGGFAGAIARYGLAAFVGRAFPSSVPYGTLTVNLLGCLALGVIIGSGLPESGVLLLGTGFVGAFTTFSTLMVEGMKLLRTRQIRSMVIYYGLTCTLGLTLAFAGYIAARYLFIETL